MDKNKRLNTANYIYQIYEEGECVLYGKAKNSSGKWGLFFGIHKGDLISRDDDYPVYEYHSYQECLDALIREAHRFAKIGYFIWHAQAIAPDGTQHKLLEGAYYSR